MSKGIFITGTDTGVGKTYVACGVAASLRSRGVDVGVMKPVETGCTMRGGKLVPQDAVRLIKAANVRDALSLVNPCRFRDPLAPLVAAEREGRKINPDTVLDAYYTLSRRHDFMIVEGAGGIMVPLSSNYLFLDLAADLAIPVVIVARPGLGTINHTLLTAAALREKRVVIAGVVINYSAKTRPGLAEKTNPGVIEKISGMTILGNVHYGSRMFDSIAAHLA